MKRAFLIPAAAAGVLLAGCGSSGHHPAASSPAAPVLLPGRSTPSSSPAPSASVTTSCTLGFDDGGALLALKAANESHPRAEKVTFVNNGSTNGVPIDEFETSVSSPGHVGTAQVASAFAPNIPFFLIPGHTYSAVIDLSHISKVTGGDSTYLHSTCSVATWD
jgi:hypothetical protein